jgi:two-component system phosphate regulon sensor histidine kinase PhoR
VDESFEDFPDEILEKFYGLKKLVNVLERDKARLSVLLASMSEAVVMVDEKERILVANTVAETFLDLPKSYENRRLIDVARVKNLSDIVSDVMWNRRPTITEVDWNAQGGDIRHFWISVAPITSSEDGNVAGAVVVMYDVTRLRRLERVRRDFVANVSHELRTPIATIQSASETLMMEGMDVGPVGIEFVESIHRHALRMGQIVEDLLTLSKLEAAGEALPKLEVDLHLVVNEILERFQPIAEKNDVSLSAEIDEDLPMVEGEPRALTQILSNLVENGLKYTPSGGFVRIRAFLQDDHVMIRVEDSGIGIPPEHIHRVFERFYRVDTGRSRDVGGTGLGLAIAKHLVRKLGGDIVLESQPKRGSTFKFWLRAHLPTGGNREDTSGS